MRARILLGARTVLKESYIQPAFRYRYSAFRYRYSAFRTMATLKQSNLKQWRFAPLDISKAASEEHVKLAGVVFDVDGTLCTL